MGHRMMIKPALGAAIALLLAAPQGAQAQTGSGDDACAQIGGPSAITCLPANAKTAVAMPTPPNLEFDNQRQQLTGLAISIDGQPVSGDGQVFDLARNADLALRRADIAVSFDGLGTKPRLDLEVVGTQRAFAPGDTVTLQSSLNYPAFVSRAEMRIIDLQAPGGPKTLAVVPVGVNQQVRLSLPEGSDLAAVHRVYDAQGRFDETRALSLTRRDPRELVSGVEDGNDATARRNIPLAGGSVTVSGTASSAAARVTTLGETVTPAPDGGFVLQRILPVGTYDIGVSVSGAGAPVNITRQIEIPKSEWFYFSVADLTAGWRDSGAYQTGRLAFYVDGRTAAGVNIRAAGDTGEGDLSNLLNDLDKRDPRTHLMRLDPDQYYPVFGDDSTYEQTAPTSGKLYLRIEKQGNRLIWGNFSSSITGPQYLTSERALYGLQGRWATQGQSDAGAPIGSVDIYAASPDTLPQREVFTGTGGSLYFLQHQDIVVGSESVVVETRDPVSGRLISSVPLSYGRDYDVNYFQGTITLNAPLAGFAAAGLGGASGNQVNLVTQYEYIPNGFNVTGQAYGGRAELQVTKGLRVGATAQVEKTATADQRAVGLDVEWTGGVGSRVRAEIARSQGPGFASSYSSNGGLTINNAAVTAGSGTAARIEAEANLRDLGLQQNGAIGGYAESRGQGFSSLEYQVSEDERLWGIYARLDAGQGLTYAAQYDAYETQSGIRENEGVLSAEWANATGLSYGLELVHIDRANATQTGTRTDLSAYGDLRADGALYLFGTVTLAQTGLGRNDRLGFGGTLDLSDRWTLDGAISDGSTGFGLRAQATRRDAAGGSLYFGYELDPDRAAIGTSPGARDQGTFVFGGSRQVTSSVSTWGENTYDLFGQRMSLTSAYGVEYKPVDALRITAGLEFGDVIDPVAGNYRREGLNFGLVHSDGDLWSTRAKLALRRDSDATGQADTAALSVTSRYAPNASERYSFNLDGVISDSNLTSVPDGSLFDISLGYAYRPVQNDRLNLLFKYRYLSDLFGQSVDGVPNAGPRQRSHVLSIDGEYDIDRNWTIGAKLGLRASETSAAIGNPFVANDAWLAAATARWHVVHDWDGLLEARVLGLQQAQTTQFGLLGAVYKQMGNGTKIGVGYNFGRFSDDLTDMVQDDSGLFLNFVQKF